MNNTTQTNMIEETYEFQAEIKQLLHILVYSLYTKKEIFIRELISNASDALDKIRYKTLTEPDLWAKDLPLEIHIDLDENHKILTISDTGIGMTKNELIQHIGTIAKSGTLEFIKTLAEEGKKDGMNMIGQFGVGFYSTFMAAKDVFVLTKSYVKDEAAQKWHSDGGGSYAISEFETDKRGTKIEVHLKDDAHEFVNKSVVEDIIKKYSNFVPYPIFLNGAQVNQVAAIWTKSKSDLTKDNYTEFYKFLTNAFDEPLSYLHITSDAPLTFHSILYIPKKNFEILGLGKIEQGLNLYCQKVLIQSECRDLLPDYLRFIRGMVDSEDISINISRETIQDNLILQKIKRFIIKKLIDHLADLLKNNRDDYIAFWNEFGRILKEGVSMDYENRDKLANLLMFNASKCPDSETLITLKEYVDRMSPEQKEIYFMGGLNRASIDSSPHVEIFKSKDIEVFYLYDPLDDIVMNALMKYADKPIKSVDQANIDIQRSSEETAKEDEAEPLAYSSNFDKFLAKMKEVLGDKVVEVRESKRLSNSPCILLNPENAPTSNIQKIMSMMNKDYKISKLILEVNKRHPLIKNLVEINMELSKEEMVKSFIEQLYDNAAMLEGLFPNPTDMVPRLHKIMEQVSAPQRF